MAFINVWSRLGTGRLTVCRLLAFAAFVLVSYRSGKCDAEGNEDEPVSAEAAVRAVRPSERDQAWEQAQRQRAAGNWREAMVAAIKVAELEAKLLGAEARDTSGTWIFIAECAEFLEDWPQAESARDAALRVTTAAYGKDDWRTTDARLARSNTAQRKGMTVAERQQLRDALRAFGKMIQLFYVEGKHAAALEIGEQICAVNERLLGPEHPDTAISLFSLAMLYDWQKNHAAAERLYQRALKIREKVLGPEHPDTATTLNKIAFLYESQRNHAAAEPLYQRALTIREKALGPEHPDTVRILNNLAAVYDSQGNYAAAESLYERALKITEKALGPEHSDTATVLNNLAALYVLQAKYAAAMPLYQRALNIHEKVLGPEHPATATSLNNLAELYKSQGNYAAAEPLYQRALKIREKALGPEHPNTATSLNNLAGLYYSQGNYAAAEPLYQRALKIREKALGPEHPETASSLNNLAMFYKSQGNYAAAEPFLQRALKILEKVLGPDHSDTAISLNNLAALYDSQENYAAALPLYQRALKIRKQALGVEHPDTADSLSNIAGVYRSQKNYAAAEPLYQQAIKIKEKALGTEHPDIASILNNLAFLYDSQENLAKSEPLYQRVLRIREKALGPEHPDTATSLHNLGHWHWQANQPEAARPLMARALEIQRRHLEQTAAMQSEQQQFLMTKALIHHLQLWLTVTSITPDTASQAWESVLAWKGLTTTRQLGLRQALKGDPLFAEFQVVSRQLSTVSLNPPLPPSDSQALVVWNERAPELRRQWEEQKTKLAAEHERLEQELARKSALFRQDQQRRVVTHTDLVASLKRAPQPTALVDLLEYGYFGREQQHEKSEWRIAAFVIRPDQPVKRIELGPASPIHAELIAWRKSLGRATADHDPGRELRRLLWEPLQPHLDGIETVLISPDGVLAQLPWGALPGEKPGTYLIEERAIAVIPVPQLLPELLQQNQNSGPPASLLLAGDIQYGGNPGASQELLAQREALGRVREGRLLAFSELPAAQSELASIERRYRKKGKAGEVLTIEGSDATEAAFREQAPQHQWLHVITHGYFAPETVRTALEKNPDQDRLGSSTQKAGPHPGLLSGLAFAGANTLPEPGQDDGILTALEVTAIDLSRVDTVVLSACETGLGEVAGGEGLLGLQRSFQVAGAKTVVASLWKVPDAATALLMQRFYENLWDKKMDKLAALREAQLWMLREGQERGLVRIDQSQPAKEAKRTPPFYWAAFVLSGDWR